MDTAAEIQIQEQSRFDLGRWLAHRTLADAVYLAILAASAFLRLYELGKLPLNPDEAEAAWSAWRFLQPGVEQLAFNSPAYFAATLLPAQLFGFSDGVMRLVPAVAGIGIVALPWLLRKRLGNIGSLTLAGLLAISPLNGAVSRMAGGDSIALFAALLFVISWVRFRDSGHSRWLTTLLMALGVGLASSGLFYGALATLLTAVGAQSLSSQSSAKIKLGLTDRIPGRDGLLISAGTFLAVSSILFLYPAGLSASSRLLVSWLARFSLRGGFEQLINPFLTLGRYELPLFMPGIVAVVWAITGNRRMARFCIYWLFALIVLIVVQPGYTQNALLALVPGYLLVSMLANDLLRERMGGATWLSVLIVPTSGMLILVNVARYSRAAAFNPQELAHLWVAVMIFAVALAALYFIGSWDAGAAVRGAFIGWILFLSFYSWGTGWWLAHEAANDPRARWIEVGTDDDTLLLRDVVERISQQATGASTTLDIYSMVDSHALRWYLRDFPGLSFGDVLPEGSDPTVIISGSQTVVAPGSDYLGADFGLEQRGSMPLDSGGPSPFLEAIRWWLFHDSTIGVSRADVVLWWRSDLIQGS